MYQLNLFNSENSLVKTKSLPSNKNLSTNVFTNHYSIHRWYNFIAGFSPEFVQVCIKDAKLNCDDVVIDPFSGLGTTLVEANFQNLFSIGFEAHPFFYDISQAKIFPQLDIQQVVYLETYYYQFNLILVV